MNAVGLLDLAYATGTEIQINFQDMEKCRKTKSKTNLHMKGWLYQIYLKFIGSQIQNLRKYH